MSIEGDRLYFAIHVPAVTISLTMHTTAVHLSGRELTVNKGHELCITELFSWDLSQFNASLLSYWIIIF